MPGSISTNAPKEVRFRTFPLIRMPTGYFCGSAIQGSSSVCFMPSETFSSVSSTFNTTASILSPIDTIFAGWRTLRVQAAQIDEGAEVGDVLDDALSHLAYLQLLHQDVALGLTLGFEQHATAHHDVAASLVQLDDLELEALAQELVDVGHAPQGDLAAREEREIGRAHV